MKLILFFKKIWLDILTFIKIAKAAVITIGAVIMITIITALFFPTWIIVFTLTLPFKKTRESANEFFIDIIKFFYLGLEIDECDRCSYDGSSICTKECNDRQKEVRAQLDKDRDKWNKSFWNWMEKHFTAAESRDSRDLCYKTGR